MTGLIYCKFIDLVLDFPVYYTMKGDLLIRKAFIENYSSFQTFKGWMLIVPVHRRDVRPETFVVRDLFILKAHYHDITSCTFQLQFSSYRYVWISVLQQSSNNRAICLCLFWKRTYKSARGIRMHSFKAFFGLDSMSISFCSDQKEFCKYDADFSFIFAIPIQATQ